MQRLYASVRLPLDQLRSALPRPLKWLSGPVLGAIVVFILLFQGYCRGWWGRHNLLMQYLFQCACPQISEAVRYRPFTVLASACEEFQA